MPRRAVVKTGPLLSSGSRSLEPWNTMANPDCAFAKVRHDLVMEHRKQQNNDRTSAPPQDPFSVQQPKWQVRT